MTSIKQIKVVILGESGVGKSSIMTRFITGTFQEDSEPTLGGAFMAKSYTHKGHSIKFQIWDTAGQEKYHSLAPMYYRDSQVAVLVYDITKKDTFEALRKWVDELKDNGPKDLMIVVVGNKIDLFEQEQITTESAGTFAKELGAIFKLTSAKEDKGIQDLFDKISDEMIKKDIQVEEAEKLKVQGKKDDKPKCC